MNEDFELAALLRDAHPPEPPPWWPLAPGWWILLIALLVLAALALRLLGPRWRRYRLRRRLLAALSAAASPAEVSQLLRAAALARFPELPAAGLHGDAWIAFLEARDRAPGRFAALHAALAEAPYRAPRAGGDLAPLRAAARGWLRSVL
jgi:uncharacterized protein DUF4381